MGTITHSISSIFEPIFKFFGWMLAFFYGVIPNYAVAIALLTVVIMGALTPFTIKSTKSMMAMQKLQPEIKKLQQKYKGPENRQVLNEELMRLYREEGANPIGGCLPVLLQAPFLFILYSVIRGLANKVLRHGVSVALPRYIPATSKMYHNLVSSHGQIKTWGMDLALKPFSSHGSWVAAIPFFAFVAVAVGLQYFQMAQMNNRNRKSGQPMPSQQLMMQRFLPIVFAYFYMVIPAAVVLYMIVSTLIRIITQDLMFRTGVSNPNKANGRSLPAAEAAADEPDPSPKPAPGTTATPPKKSGPVSKRTEPQRPAPKPSTFKSPPQPRSRAKRKRKAR
jgi:YidC/Oxa1 family membrane protein insertase